MVGIKIDGKVIAQSVKERVKKAVNELKSQGTTPCLATVLVGDNPASAIYVRMEYEEINIREFSEKFLSMQSHQKMHLEIKK